MVSGRLRCSMFSISCWDSVRLVVMLLLLFRCGL